MQQVDNLWVVGALREIDAGVTAPAEGLGLGGLLPGLTLGRAFNLR